VSNQNLEQRFKIKIYVKLGRNTSETGTMISEAHGKKPRRNKVLQSGIHISKRFHKNKDTERSSHPKMISPNENAEKVWNLVIQTRQDILQVYYIDILKLCETVHKKRPELLSKNLFLHH
jgi:hypothetical protein